MTISGLRKDRQTPGVYVTEFPAFPPTVLGVRTAVPCFIGYTERAEDPTTKKGLLNTPVPIDSLTAFNSYFGGGKPQDAGFMISLATPPTTAPAAGAAGPDFRAGSAQLLADKKQINIGANLDCSVKRQSGASDGSTDGFSLYGSMQMFYANGGGFCYVISVGNYGAGKKKDDLINGLALAYAIHDVTMLVIPDACLLGEEDYGAVANAMLAQAGDLRNRVAILDLPGAIDTFDQPKLKQKANTFYNAISPSQDAFSYGAAYGPGLQTSLISSDDLNFLALADASKENGGTPGKFNLAINHLLTTQALSRCLNDPEKLSDALAKIAQAFPVSDGATAISADAVETIVNTDGRSLLDKDGVKTLLKNCACLASATITLEAPAGANSSSSTNASEAGAAGDASGGSQADAQAGDTKGDASATTAAAASTDAAASTGAAAGAPAAVATSAGGGPLVGVVAIAPPAANAASAGGGSAAAAPPATPPNTDNLNKFLVNVTPLLSQILKVVSKQVNLIPASGVMAGIWSKSDAINGVWNAPANMAINRAISPLVVLNDKEQGAYNVPPDGKSIGILRALPGKGTVVWGARTLDGNSNDYRYIQVRRNLIYIEQSVKQSLQDFVFKENDAKTWTTVTSMITNFLTSHWQAGGLMGSKANEAFSVACGKPSTMTDLDILNGYMIVSIALSCIRPAEFIEITITQAMQGS